MNVLTIEEVRRQCNIDFNSEDEQLTACAMAAETHVLNYTHRTLDELRIRGYREQSGVEVEDAADLPDGNWVPAPIRSAMLMLAADLYVHREKQNAQTLTQNAVYDLLLKPYRRF